MLFRAISSNFLCHLDFHILFAVCGLPLLVVILALSWALWMDSRIEPHERIWRRSPSLSQDSRAEERWENREGTLSDVSFFLSFFTPTDKMPNQMHSLTWKAKYRDEQSTKISSSTLKMPAVLKPSRGRNLLLIELFACTSKITCRGKIEREKQKGKKSE